MRVRRWPASLAIVSILGIAAAVHAQPTEQARTLANTLFDDARRLMDEGRVAEACPKFAESQRLQPGGGTLLNLGICHAREGKTGSAWGELRAALALARRDARDDRETLALEELKVVEATLSTLVVEVPPEVRVDGLTVSLDGLELVPATWGVPQPVDPGEHTVIAAAPGRETWTSTVAADASSRKLAVRVAALKSLAPPTAPASASSKAWAPHAERRDGLSGQHIGALVAGGIGVVAAGLGTGFGLAAAGRQATSDEACPTAVTCSVAGKEASDDAGRLADLSTASFVIAASSVALGAVLWITAPPIESPPPSSRGQRRRATAALVTIGPVVTIGPLGAQLRGRF